MTYKEAEDKIIQAYFRDEIKPFDSSFCICGTLHGSETWNLISYWPMPESPYTYEEYKRIEWPLLFGINEFLSGKMVYGDRETSSHWEDALFYGMCAALEVLKQIHIDRGENIDPVPFKKRQLSESRL